jgi:transporter family-2 protein
MMLLFIFIAALSGVGIAAQAMINARLSEAIHSSIWAAVVSFVVGLAGLLAVALGSREAVPSVQSGAGHPWWIWCGGFFGAAFIYLAVILAPRLGAALLIGAVIVGQILGSLVIDHYGLFGTPMHRMNLPRLIGAALLLGGIALVRK